MHDTVKIPRPKFERKKQGAGGRVEHDSRGNAIWVRTRASDQSPIPEVPDLSIAEEPQKPRPPKR